MGLRVGSIQQRAHHRAHPAPAAGSPGTPPLRRSPGRILPPLPNDTGAATGVATGRDTAPFTGSWQDRGMPCAGAGLPLCVEPQLKNVLPRQQGVSTDYRQ